MGSIICLFRLILQANPLFCFHCGLWVASKSNVDSITFLSGVLILLCEYKSFLIFEFAISISFEPVCLSSSGSDLFQHPQDQLKSSQRCLFHPSQAAFVSCPPTLFLQGFRFLNQLSTLMMEVSPFFSFMFLPGDSHEDSNGASSSSLFTHFLLRWIQIKLWCSSYPLFSSFQIPSHAGAPHIHSFLAIQLFRSAKDISEDSCLHSAFVQALSRMYPHSSHLIQPVLSLF